MAELQFKLGAGSNYEDKDVLCAFNGHRIQTVHAYHQCFPRLGHGLQGMTARGLMPANHLSQDWCEAVYELRFERLSKTEAQYTRLSDRVTLRIEDGKPFTDLQGRPNKCVHFEQLFRRKLGSRWFPVFGSVGREIIYCGRQDMASTAIAKVWDAIEAKTGKRRDADEFTLWPAGRVELKTTLFVPVENFSDSEAGEMTASIMDLSDPENPRIVKKRRYGATSLVAIAAHLGVSEADIRNPTISVDRRREVQPLARVGMLTDKQAEKAK